MSSRAKAVVALMMVAETLRTNLELRLRDNTSRSLQSLAQIHGEGIMKAGVSVCDGFNKGIKRAVREQELQRENREMRSRFLYDRLEHPEAFGAMAKPGSEVNTS